IAFIIDRYLYENNFTETRKSFWIEASLVIANSLTKEVPKSLMSLGKVTPIQIAFIVDRYLYENNFTETPKSFWIEASLLIANSPIKEVPKSLMSLCEMLHEYICLKEQKVALDQERVYMEREKKGGWNGLKEQRWC
ncbi:hypothetical protein RYX36_011427, partial [Vicia faba]